MSNSIYIQSFDPLSWLTNHQADDQQYSKNRKKNMEISNLFELVAKQPWSMLLHSGNSEHQNSRFDIMVADPIAHITSHSTHNQILNLDGKLIQSSQDPLIWIKQTLTTHFNSIETHPVLPFLGGALGYFAYDLGSKYEVLPQQSLDDMHTPLLKVGIYDWAIIKDNHQQQWWFVSHRLSLESVMALLQNKQTPSATGFQIRSTWQSNLDPSTYQHKFHQIQTYLLSGDCYQINLAQRFNAQYQGDEYTAFNALLAVNRTPFSAFLRFDDFSILSVSPERLLLLDQQHIETKPIKGTIDRAIDTTQDHHNIQQLYHSTKDRAENVMIVDLLRNDLGKVCITGSVKVPSLFAVETFPAVHHLVSTVTGQLQPHLHATDLLRSVFPGGSITGAPKLRAMEIIDELEPHRRSVYCGSIGYICCSGRMDTSITIRTLLCKNQMIYCWAGGGIVADSNHASEYQETLAKVSKILPTLSEMNQ